MNLLRMNSTGYNSSFPTKKQIRRGKSSDPLKLSKTFKVTNFDGILQFTKKDKYFIFSVVRHPFERLVSAFENKVVRGPMMVATTNKYYGFYKQFNNSFPLFVEFVLKQIRETLPGLVDIHWRPMYTRCGYCKLPYDFIVKVETMREDFQYIYKSLGLSGKFPMPDVTNGSERENDWMDYFTLLTSDTIEQLKRVYLLDFMLFDYSFYSFELPRTNSVLQSMNTLQKKYS